MRATGRSAQTCPLPGVDPDDTYNETPYEKGFCFVSYLAHLVGDQDRFDAFLKVPSPRMGEKGQGRWGSQARAQGRSRRGDEVGGSPGDRGVSPLGTWGS